MVLNRLTFCWLALVTIFLSDVSYSSVGRFRDVFNANMLLKSWRRKAEEQRVRLFDRLPQDIESKYTTVINFSSELVDVL